MTRTTKLVLAALCLLSIVPLTAQAGGTISANYIGVTGDAELVCDPLGDGSTGLGGVCISLEGTETSAAVDIEDATEMPVGALARFAAAVGSPSLGDTLFCDTASLSVPAGSGVLVVFIDEANGVLDCPDDPPGAGTVGVVNVTFS